MRILGIDPGLRITGYGVVEWKLRPTLVAGGEDGRLFRSCDQGETWVLMATLADAVPINGLCWLPAGGWLVAGLGDGRVLRSADQGLNFWRGLLQRRHAESLSRRLRGGARPVVRRARGRLLGIWP